MKMIKMTTIAILMSIGLAGAAHAGDSALICTSSSTGACQNKPYCCYSGNQSDGDKFCKQLGCVRGGTSSCPTAANIKSCGTRTK